MDGSSRGRQPPLELRREFADSRLEEQILIRVFEMVVPAIRCGLKDDQRSMPGPSNEQFNSSSAKGA